MASLAGTIIAGKVQPGATELGTSAGAGTRSDFDSRSSAGKGIVG